MIKSPYRIFFTFVLFVNVSSNLFAVNTSIKSLVEIVVPNSKFTLVVGVLSGDILKISFRKNDDLDFMSLQAGIQPNLPSQDSYPHGWLVEKKGTTTILRRQQKSISIDKSPFKVTFYQENKEKWSFGSPQYKDFFEVKNKPDAAEYLKRKTYQLDYYFGEKTDFYGLGFKVRHQCQNQEDHVACSLHKSSLSWTGSSRDPLGPIMTTLGNQLDLVPGGGHANVNIPFLLTNNGYALLWDTNYHTQWDFQKQQMLSYYQDCDVNWVSGISLCQKSHLGFYVFLGDLIKDNLKLYSSLVGKSKIPPLHFLGYLQSNFGYRSFDHLEEVKSKMNTHKMPVSAYFLDIPSFGGVPGIYHDEGKISQKYRDCKYRKMGTFDWSREKEFDFSDALRRIKKLAIPLYLIVDPYVDTCSPAYAQAKKNTIFATNFFKNDVGVYGNDYNHHLDYTDDVSWAGKISLVNLFPNENRKWYWQQVKKFLQDGVSGFWLDLGEPEKYRWYWQYTTDEQLVDQSGKKSTLVLFHHDINNLWELMRINALAEGWKQDYPDKRPFFLSRSSALSAHTYGTGIWAGDTPADGNWLLPLLQAQLHAGLSGIHYIATDIGGFGGFPVANGDLYTRWLQFAAFSPLMRAHGNTIYGAHRARKVHPYEYEEPYLSINRDYLYERQSLLPYLASLSLQSYRDGIPLVRPLFLEFPKDAKSFVQGDSYMLGDTLLIAPVVSFTAGKSALKRDIYLPPGYWWDLQTNKQIEGPLVIEDYPCPISCLPRFLRQGQVLPRIVAQSEYSWQNYFSERVYQTFPGEETVTTEIGEDDGESYQYLQNQVAYTQIKVGGEIHNKVFISQSEISGNHRKLPQFRRVVWEVFLTHDPVNLTVNGNTVAITKNQVKIEKTQGQVTAQFEENVRLLRIVIPNHDLKNKLRIVIQERKN